MTDANPRRKADLLVALVVAVHMNAGRLEAGLQRHVQLAARGHVNGETLLGKQAIGGGAREGLAGEENLEVVGSGRKGIAVGASPVSHVVLGIDVGGSAELRGQIDDVAPSHLEVATLVYPAAFRVDQGGRDRVSDRA